MKLKNNAVSEIITPLLKVWTSFICKEWEWDLFPSENFEIFIEYFESWIIKKREAVKISSRQNDIFNIEERAFEECVQDEWIDKKIRSKVTLEFPIGSQISQYISETKVDYIDNELIRLENDKLDKSDPIVTEFNKAGSLAKVEADGNLPDEIINSYTKTDADSRFVNIDNDEVISWKKTFEKKIEVWNKNHIIEEKDGNVEITTSWKIKVKSEELEIDGIITTNKEQSEKINAYVRKDYVDNLLAIAGWWWFKAVSEVKYGNNGKLQEFMWDGKKYTLTYSNKWQLIWVNNWEQEFEIKYNNKWELYSIKLK